MSESSAGSDQLGALFVRVTGQSTVTERQSVEVPVRFIDTSKGTDLSKYVGSQASAPGLDDAIDVPEQS